MHSYTQNTFKKNIAQYQLSALRSCSTTYFTTFNKITLSGFDATSLFDWSTSFLCSSIWSTVRPGQTNTPFYFDECLSLLDFANTFWTRAAFPSVTFTALTFPVTAGPSRQASTRGFSSSSSNTSPNLLTISFSFSSTRPKTMRLRRRSLSSRTSLTVFFRISGVRETFGDELAIAQGCKSWYLFSPGATFRCGGCGIAQFDIFRNFPHNFIHLAYYRTIFNFVKGMILQENVF